MDEPFGLVAKFDVDIAYRELEGIYDVVQICLRLPWPSVVMCMCMRGLLPLVLIMFPPIPLIILMFPLCVYNLHLPASIILMLIYILMLI